MGQVTLALSAYQRLVEQSVHVQWLGTTKAQWQRLDVKVPRGQELVRTSFVRTTLESSGAQRQPHMTSPPSSICTQTYGE
jgi:hypothetical protein